jgi:MEMO1 family protein
MSLVRPTAVAGRFYPGSAAECRRAVERMLTGVNAPVGVGAVVPHAGWIFSGSTAALGLSGIAGGTPETIILFGAVHSPDMNFASVYPAGAWDTPLGPIPVDEDLAEQIACDNRIERSPQAHRREHSIEVQLPMLKVLLPDARIVPVGVRPSEMAPEIGRVCARAALELGNRVAFVASTDLTHYGPAFGFEPHGHGDAGVRWAKDVNDRRFVALIQSASESEVVPEASINYNACGSGAVAALLGAVNELGGLRYQELRHTCSAECTAVADRDPYNSVGYEAGVFVRRSPQ